MPDLIRNASAWLAVTAFLMATSTDAQSKNIRYVSTKGANTNPCTFDQPCKTLQRGINQTPDGGEVHVLDSGWYGANGNIKKSITISGNGHTVVLGNPLTIDKDTALVALRGLVLNGEGGTQQAGIWAIAAAAVSIERCVVYGFTNHGILSGGNTAKLSVIDSIIRHNGMRGLYVFQTPKVSIDNTRFENNGDSGIHIQGSSSYAVVGRSVVAANQLYGIVAQGSRMTVTRTTAANNRVVGFRVVNSGHMMLEFSQAHGHGIGDPLSGVGLNVLSSSIAIISNSVFVSNDTGIVNSATVLTRGNNTVSGNGVNVIGALTAFGGV